MVQLYCFELSIELTVRLVLLIFLSADILPITILLIQYRILSVHYIHLQNCSGCVFFGAYDLNLLLVVF